MNSTNEGPCRGMGSTNEGHAPMKKGEPVGSLYFAPHGLLFCRLVQVRLIEGSFEKSNTGREGLAGDGAFFMSR